MSTYTVGAKEYRGRKYLFPMLIDGEGHPVLMVFDHWLPKLLGTGEIVLGPHTILWSGPRKFPSGQERRPAWLVAHAVAHLWQRHERGWRYYLDWILGLVRHPFNHDARGQELDAGWIGHAIQYGIYRKAHGYPADISAEWISRIFPPGDNPQGAGLP